MCNVVIVSHLYVYLALTENNVTGDVALTGVGARCVCGTGPYDSDANSSTVCADHRQCGAGNYTSVPRQQHPEPKVRSVRGQQVQRSRIAALLEICTGCVARQCAEGEGPTNCTFRSAGQYQDAVGSAICTLCASGMYQDAAGKTECKVRDFCERVAPIRVPGGD